MSKEKWGQSDYYYAILLVLLNIDRVQGTSCHQLIQLIQNTSIRGKGVFRLALVAPVAMRTAAPMHASIIHRVIELSSSLLLLFYHQRPQMQPLYIQGVHSMPLALLQSFYCSLTAQATPNHHASSIITKYYSQTTRGSIFL